MPALIPVAILGFDATIRLALAASLRGTAKRQPGYKAVLGLDDARYVVLDADDPEGLALLRTLGRMGDAVTVGAQPPNGPDPARVLDLALVLQGLDALAALDGPEPAAAHPSASQYARPPEHPPAGQAVAEADLLPSQPDTLSASLTSERQRARREARRNRKAAETGWVAPRALLVDDSDIALHFLRRQLTPYGIACDFARDSDRALELLRQQRYGLILLDLDLGEHSRLDGFALCHRMLQQAATGGTPPPPIAIVSAFQGQVVQVRCTLAGAQGFLGKPLDPLALRAVLQKLVALPAILPSQHPADPSAPAP